MLKYLFLISFLFITMPVYAGKGVVEITSEPLGAKIFLNGQRKGSTPQQAGKALLLELEEGEYKLEAKIDDDSLATFDLFIASGAIQPVHLVLEKLLKIGDKFVKAGETFQDCDDCPGMVLIPAGTFEMGNNDGSDDEKPVHIVSIKHFAMGKYEVTFEEYDKFCEATGHDKPDDEGWGRGKRPVINVSWEDAVAYAQWLSQKTNKAYRLPTEAEWEYAARAGSTGEYSFGDDVSRLGKYAWYDNNSGNQTHPVGEKQPNTFNLYDMHGNVWEWCEDSWHDNYNGAPSDGSAWKNSNENMSLLRGGSWYSFAYLCRSALRNTYYQVIGFNTVGVRVVCGVRA